eukprot:8458753-Lingulodinium_polyedra.AAC.1
MAHGHLDFAMVVLLSHHALLRPDEAQSLCAEDIVIFGDAHFPNVHGLVCIRRPKTRRNPAHAPRQHVLIEDAALARWLAWALRPAAPSEPLWPHGAAAFSSLWREGLAALNVLGGGWTPAGLRGGGATEHFLCRQD